MRVGVLALQGDVEEHEAALRRAAASLGKTVEVVRVKRVEDLDAVSALALPGGESTVFSALGRAMRDKLREKLEGGLPFLATCAGAIYLAKDVADAAVGKTRQDALGVLDIAVVRNAYGRQRHSFEAALEVEGVGQVKAVFIRAPAIVKVWGRARPLAYVDTPRFGKTPAAVAQGLGIATTFHPELADPRLHAYLLSKL